MGLFFKNPMIPHPPYGGSGGSAPARSAGVVTARRKGGSGNRGRPVTGEGSGLNVATGGGTDGSRTTSVIARGRIDDSIGSPSLGLQQIRIIE